MVEFIARHNISSGKKGERVTIKAGERFNPEDYPAITMEEWKAMYQNGNVRSPDDPNYAAVPGIEQQRAAANAPVPEGRSPRTDLGGRAAVSEGGITRPTATEDTGDEDGDEDEAEAAPARSRRGRRAKPAEEDDDDI